MKNYLLTSTVVPILTVVFGWTVSSFIQPKQVPIGNFYGGTGYEGCFISFKPDSSFKQESYGCTWHYFTQGKWAVINDTIKLSTKKIYSVNSDRKKSLITDSMQLDYRKFYQLNKLIFISPDTLGLLVKYPKEPITLMIKLKRTADSNSLFDSK